MHARTSILFIIIEENPSGYPEFPDGIEANGESRMDSICNIPDTSGILQSTCEDTGGVLEG